MTQCAHLLPTSQTVLLVWGQNKVFSVHKLEPDLNIKDSAESSLGNPVPAHKRSSVGGCEYAVLGKSGSSRQRYYLKTNKCCALSKTALPSQPSSSAVKYGSRNK